MNNYRIIIAIASITLSACSDKTTEVSNQETNTISDSNIVQLTEAQTKTINLQLGKIEPRALSNTIKANGQLDVPPQNMVTVSATLGGFVKHTSLLQGMRVKKGQIIATMEHPDYIQLQQDYLENKSKLDFYEAELTRQQELAKENINATKTLQEAQSNYQGTKAKVDGLQSKLKLININADELEKGNIRNTINIYAPIDGYVTQVHVNIGKYVNPTDVLFKIVDTKHLHAEVFVFEKDVLKIKIGQKIRLQLTNESTERTARVYLIGREISPERTVSVHGHLEKEDDNLLPGMYFSALFESGENEVPSLPEEAIVNFEGKDYVFVARDASNREYEMIEISKGVCESGYCEVTLQSGLDMSSEIVMHGSYDLLSYLKNKEEE
ncbi:MAG: efflux RND transporter periplasmic adaptor subunit [Cyclobacteriaceae bacterium]|nr:efflux RND transporter periplasmic adaptor subunit [Cyclobacteriaceae bacterium]